MGALRRHARQGDRGNQEVHGPRWSRAECEDRGESAARSTDRPGQAQEARTALDNRQFEQAEAIALDVKKWGLTYGLFEDNPDKVAAAARALRRRDKIRNTPPREQSSQGVYDILVQESRQLMSVGKLDEAEAKARRPSG